MSNQNITICLDDMVPVADKASTIDLKPSMERCLRDRAVTEAIQKFITDKGHEGSKGYDMLRTMDIIEEADLQYGGLIRASSLNSQQKVSQLLSVMRRHFELDKKTWKILGPNPKRYLTGGGSGSPAPAAE